MDSTRVVTFVVVRLKRLPDDDSFLASRARLAYAQYAKNNVNAATSRAALDFSLLPFFDVAETTTRVLSRPRRPPDLSRTELEPLAERRRSAYETKDDVARCPPAARAHPTPAHVVDAIDDIIIYRPIRRL